MVNRKRMTPAMARPFMVGGPPGSLTHGAAVREKEHTTPFMILKNGCELRTQNAMVTKAAAFIFAPKRLSAARSITAGGMGGGGTGAAMGTPACMLSDM